MKKLFSLSLIILITIINFTCNFSLLAAVSVTTPAGTASYLSRAEIDTLAATKETPASLGSAWSGLLAGHLEFIAQIYGLYPTGPIYFLARDSEYLYDMMKLALKDNPQEAKRIKLLNVNRLTVNDKHLKNYLIQEGISPQSLQAGAVTLIDTGFRGSISQKIKEIFGKVAEKNLQTHFIVSFDPNIPSSRTFLQQINAHAYKATPDEFNELILSYEHLPKAQTRAFQYWSDSTGHWHPLVKLISSDPSEDLLDPAQALLYRQDLKRYSLKSGFQEAFQQKVAFWREARKKIQQGEWKSVYTYLQERLNQATVEDAGDPPKEIAQIKDLIDWSKKNASHLKKMNFPLEESDFSFKFKRQYDDHKNLNFIKKYYPQISAFLNNPETWLASKNLSPKELAEHAKIVASIDDADFQNHLVEVLAKHPHWPFIEQLLAIAPKDFLFPLVLPVIDGSDLSQAAMIKQIEHLLDFNDPAFALHLFEKLGKDKNLPLYQQTLLRAYEKDYPFYRSNLIQHILSNPETLKWSDLYRLAFNTLDNKTTNNLVHYSALVRGPQLNLDLLKELISKVSSEQVGIIVQNMPFSWLKNHQDLFMLIFEKLKLSSVRPLIDQILSNASPATPLDKQSESMLIYLLENSFEASLGTKVFTGVCRQMEQIGITFQTLQALNKILQQKLDQKHWDLLRTNYPALVKKWNSALATEEKQ
ncbi:MAG: hypothetical protein HQK50_08875 [Oligoflexia bacterium]|nr:hypothetical protein [Oligoflexia bacterium]MBF0365672.1 hypothetical protein [Oligoflexia bacterium]